jgi:uncharacterized membrane protein
LPLIIGLLSFTVIPVAASIYFSLTDYPIFDPPKWVGPKNYLELVSDGRFWLSVWNTFYFVLFAVPLGMLVGLCLALLALGSGAARVVWFGKGAAFYLHNPVFYIKIALFLAVGLISIPPTMQFLRWTRSLTSGATNVASDYQVIRVRRHILIELTLFALIPLMATLMARGIGIQTVAQ